MAIPGVVRRTAFGAREGFGVCDAILAMPTNKGEKSQMKRLECVQLIIIIILIVNDGRELKEPSGHPSPRQTCQGAREGAGGVPGWTNMSHDVVKRMNNRV